jgi:hypothetical protein
MAHTNHRNDLAWEIAKIFSECRESVENAVREYEEEIRSAVDDLERNLTRTPGLVH